MSYFQCFSVTVSTIYCFNPTLRLCFVRNWALLYINGNANHCALLSRSSYYRFTFLCVSLQNKKLLKSYEYQLVKRWFSGRLEGFKVSLWFLKIVKLVEYRIATKCHDFHHCCRWLQKSAKEGKREGSACHESRCFCMSPQSPSFFPSSVSPTPFDARYAGYKNGKSSSNYKANPIGFETQISLRG